MANPLLQHYIKLTEFLGQALGPDYEVALHDLTDKNRSIIAIANNHVSGREVGAPLTNVALQDPDGQKLRDAGLPPALLRCLRRGQNAALLHAVH